MSLIACRPLDYNRLGLTWRSIGKSSPGLRLSTNFSYFKGMKTLILRPLLHHGQEQIGIYCEQEAAINTILHRQAGAKWSRTHRCWYLPMEEGIYEKLVNALDGKVIIENGELKEYLKGKKQENPVAKQLPADSVRVFSPTPSIRQKAVILPGKIHPLQTLMYCLPWSSS